MTSIYFSAFAFWSCNAFSLSNFVTEEGLTNIIIFRGRPGFLSACLTLPAALSTVAVGSNGRSDPIELDDDDENEEGIH